MNNNNKAFIITKKFSFESAHNLTSYNGKCETLHGHNYKLEVSIKGTPDKEGIVIDFVKLKSIVKKEIINKIDHIYLNDLFDFSPTSENILLWIEKRLKDKLTTDRYKLYKLTLWETENNKAELFV